MIDWRPSAPLENLRLRAELMRKARQFFFDRGVLEVETPILSAGATVDPQIESLHTQISGFAHPRYLSTSPEFAMKRLLAAGVGDIFQICKVFRDGELGQWHQPEFTMIEWYRLGFDDTRLMDEVDLLVRELLAPRRTLPASERLTYADALSRHAGVDMRSATDADLARSAAAHGIDYRGQLDRDGMLDLLMGMIVGPLLGHDGPTFICDYPASQASLARVKARTPGVASADATRSMIGAAGSVAARFELYLDGLELANGFHELADVREHRRRFHADIAARAHAGKPQPPIDEQLLNALAAGLPDCAGVALGFDRLLAVDARADDLKSVIAFDFERA